MLRSTFGLVFASLLLGFATESKAQAPFGGVNDPFLAYYSLYLPRQQALANSPGPEATINAITSNRQQYAATNRNEMFDPSSQGLGLGDSGDYGFNSGSRPRNGTGAMTSRLGGNLNGLGPAGHYNRVKQYHPGIRAGIYKNNNVSVIRSRGFSQGYGGGNLGLPGPR